MTSAGCSNNENAALGKSIEELESATEPGTEPVKGYNVASDSEGTQEDAAYFGSTLDFAGVTFDESSSDQESGKDYDGKDSKSAGTKKKEQSQSGQKGKEAASDTKGEKAAEPTIDRSGSYTSKEDVALYLHIYGDLPDNFITKKEARKLGWKGGSLEKYAPGMCIGGDRYSNFEGSLPEDSSYWECDIDTLGKKSRGAKRIVYSDDGFIYYTGNHYASFELMYEP
ncbi:MAG: ribonuclease [Butyrivibrio sp.]|nr:ribonuclease [Butyrivibrio sp.]